MAIIEFINNKGRNSGTIAHLKKLCSYSQKDTKTESKYITGYNCTPEIAFEQFINTKLYYNKKGGRNFIHFVQSFSPHDNVSLSTAHEIGCKLANRYKNDFEVIIATHRDTEKIHTHFIINSVSLNGKKFQQSKKDLQKLKDYSDTLCREYGLSTINQKNKNRTSYKEYQARINNRSWKLQLEHTIEHCMKISNSKTEFIKNMLSYRYKVKWIDSRKYITYTTPKNIKCRDIRLSDKKFSKNEMQKYFENKEINKSLTFLVDELLNINETEKVCNDIDLSKQARKELYIKNRNKSFLWEKEK